METPRRKPFRIEVQVTPHVVGEAHRIGFVVDRERRSVPEQGCFASQDPGARGVERRDPHLASDGPDERGDAILHLARGLVGERDREDLERGDVPFANEIRDSMREQSRLPRAGAGDHEYGTIGRGHGIALYGIQAFEELRRAHSVQRRRCSGQDSASERGSSRNSWVVASATGLRKARRSRVPSSFSVTVNAPVASSTSREK